MVARLGNEAHEYKIWVMLRKQVLNALYGAVVVITRMVFSTSTFAKRLDFLSAKQRQRHKESPVRKVHLLTVDTRTVSAH